MPALHDLLNRVNDSCWTGAFSYWPEQKLVVWRYGLVLSGGQIATPEQIDRMIVSAVEAAERFYPAFQLAVWGERHARRRRCGSPLPRPMVAPSLRPRA